MIQAESVAFSTKSMFPADLLLGISASSKIVVKNGQNYFNATSLKTPAPLCRHELNG